MSKSDNLDYEALFKDFPNFLRASDLVKMGLYPSKFAVYKAKERGKAPPCIQISKRKLRFLKNDLIAWLKSR